MYQFFYRFTFSQARQPYYWDVALWVVLVVVVLSTLIGLRVRQYLKLFILAIQLASNTEFVGKNMMYFLLFRDVLFIKLIEYNIEVKITTW